MSNIERIDDLVKTFEQAVTSIEKFSKKISDQKSLIENVDKKMQVSTDELSKYLKEDKLFNAYDNFNKILLDSSDKLSSNNNLLIEFKNLMISINEKYNNMRASIDKSYQDLQTVITNYKNNEAYIKEQFENISKFINESLIGVTKLVEESVLNLKVEVDGIKNEINTGYYDKQYFLNAPSSNLPNINLFGTGKYNIVPKSWHFYFNKLIIIFNVVSRPDGANKINELVYVFDPHDKTNLLSQLLNKYKVDLSLSIKDNLDIIIKSEQGINIDITDIPQKSLKILNK